MVILFKEPSKPARLFDIEGTIEEFENLCQGELQIVYAEYDMAILCNVNGRLLGLEPNIPVSDCGFADVIEGNVVIVSVRTEGNGFCSLEDDQIEILRENEYFEGGHINESYL